MAASIFITGATGNIGAAVVCGLLDREDHDRLTVLVRGGSGPQVTQRLVEAVRVYRPDLSGEMIASRIEAVSGDIARPRLGLDRITYSRLTAETTHIVHSAAVTCFDVDEKTADAVNASGTAHVLEFAQQAMTNQVLRRMVHVSTAYICGHDAKGMVSPDDMPEHPPHTNVYERSKWKAERMVRERFKALPLVLARPSIVVGEATTGRVIRFNVLYPPLRLLLPCLGNHPMSGLDGSLDIVPVDYVAAVCERLLLHPDVREGGCYHLTAGVENCCTVDQVLAAAASLAPQHHRRRLRSHPDVLKVLGRLATYRPYLSFRAGFERRATDRLTAGTGLSVRPVTDYLAVLLSYCRQTGWGKRRKTEEVSHARDRYPESLRANG